MFNRTNQSFNLFQSNFAFSLPFPVVINFPGITNTITTDPLTSQTRTSVDWVKEIFSIVVLSNDRISFFSNRQIHFQSAHFE